MKEVPKQVFIVERDGTPVRNRSTRTLFYARRGHALNFAPTGAKVVTYDLVHKDEVVKEPK